ncbi:type IV pilus modification protein PilV [Pseudomonas sp. N040]|nr:type IV pilus modification protein PilV [Pseudomonas sp. N040]MBW7013883.1 type IV pilus modification protein PilV [Pseudomonas sp. N040]
MTLIEVMVTVFILAVGLLGMAGLQARLQQSEMEAYQRSQALMLLQDMASRLATNRNSADLYEAATSAAASGAACPTNTATQVDRDASEWCNALQGAGETSGSSKAGAMIGGRGCVEATGNPGEYMITVAWQGLNPLSAPPASVACGKDLYDGGVCSGDLCRRVVTTIVRVASL